MLTTRPALTRRPGRRQALAGLLMGTAALLSGGSQRTMVARKKRKHRACPTCPAPTICTAPDTCPVRSCCVCKAPSSTPGCRTIPVAGYTLDTVNPACEQACGGPGTVAGSWGTVVGQTLVCNDVRNTCVRAACPL